MRLNLPERRADRILLIYSAAVAIGFGLLTVLGISQSSIGTGSLQVSGETSADVLLGSPRPIRSDEFFRSSPNLLGQAAVGNSDFESPLAADATLTAGSVDGGIAEQIVFFDRTALQAAHWLPDAIQFSFAWWQWIALTAVFLPLLLRCWSVPLPLMLFATFAVLFSPGTAWWSYSPLQSVALASVVAVCIAMSWRVPQRRRPLWLLLLVLVGGVCLARLPYQYFPFAFPLSLGIILPMVAVAVARPQHRRVAAVVSLGILVLGAALALGVLAENAAAAQVLSETGYPGQRRTGGAALDVGFVFGAPFLGILQDDPMLLAKNQSELSTGWTFLSVVALVVVAATRPVRASRHALIALGLLLAGGLSWILYNWPAAIGEAIPLASSVPPPRLAAVIGIPASIALAVALTPLWGDPSQGSGRRARLGLTALAATVLGLVFAGSHLQTSYLPDLSSPSILAISLAAGAGVALATAGTRWAQWIGIAVLVLGMASTVWRVSPVMAGLGDLRGSTASDRVVALAGSRSPQDGYWASDTWEVSALLTANGIPTLNGDQWTGPSEEWLTLDPERSYQSAWNRGASIIYFVWDSTAMEPVVSVGRPDQILVQTSPCAPAMAALDLRYVVSATPLAADCLRTEGAFDYAGRTQHLYRVRAPDAAAEAG